MPGLLARLRASAPGVSLRLRSINRMSVLDELDAGRLDLGIGVFTQGQIHHKRRSLYADNFLCLFSPEQLRLTPPISLEDYLRVPHVLTSLSDEAHGAVDEALAKHKLKRTIAMTTPGFLAVPFVLRRAPVITTMPSRLARYFAEAFGLATSPAPIELPASPSRCFGMRASTKIRGISGFARRCRGLPRRWVWSSETARRAGVDNCDMSPFRQFRLASSWRHYRFASSRWPRLPDQPGSSKKESSMAASTASGKVAPSCPIRAATH